MIQFEIAGTFTGTFEDGIITIDRPGPVARLLEGDLQREIDSRRELATGYSPGPDEYAIQALMGWPHRIIKRTPPDRAPAGSEN